MNFRISLVEDFATLITQAPKWGIATTIAHHERFGQLQEDPRILGATSAIVNKVLFQVTTRDASELAAEFADKPPFETKREPELPGLAAFSRLTL